MLMWLGNRLKACRGEQAMRAVADSAKVPQSQIRALEKGDFRLGLGQLRHIVGNGYHANFGDLLKECFEAHQTILDPKEERPFERDYYYSLSSRPNKDSGPTPLLIGGDPRSFLWALPMRRLKDQPMVTELLELSPVRKRTPAGSTSWNSHAGSEVIYIINGSIRAYVNCGGKWTDSSRKLQRGDTFHFRSDLPHYIENAEKTSPALLLVVRIES